jgi:hypothetical protein
MTTMTAGVTGAAATSTAATTASTATTTASAASGENKRIYQHVSRLGATGDRMALRIQFKLPVKI